MYLEIIESQSSQPLEAKEEERMRESSKESECSNTSPMEELKATPEQSEHDYLGARNTYSNVCRSNTRFRILGKLRIRWLGSFVSKNIEGDSSPLRRQSENGDSFGENGQRLKYCHASLQVKRY